jgi:hypothetical protein
MSFQRLKDPFSRSTSAVGADDPADRSVHGLKVTQLQTLLVLPLKTQKSKASPPLFRPV